MEPLYGLFINLTVSTCCHPGWEEVGSCKILHFVGLHTSLIIFLYLNSGELFAFDDTTYWFICHEHDPRPNGKAGFKIMKWPLVLGWSSRLPQNENTTFETFGRIRRPPSRPGIYLQTPIWNVPPWVMKGEGWDEKRLLRDHTRGSWRCPPLPCKNRLGRLQ